MVEQPRWAPSVAVGLLVIGGFAWGLSDSWLLSVLATASVAIALWQYLLPVTYEIHSLGVYRHALGRARLLPWHAIRAYQPRSTGIILFQRTSPTPLGAFGSWFVPYAADEDEMLCAIRQHLSHAIELP